MKFHRLISAVALVLFVTCVVGIARAQTQPWDTNALVITPPTTCTTGEPVSACPVTGYRIEQSATATGTFASLVALPATTLTFSHTSVSAGQHCYRVFALSAQGDSPASNVGCFTNVKPAGPPSAPGLKVNGVIAYNVVPNYQRFVFERGRAVGRAKLGAACDEDRCVDGGFCVISRPSMAVTPKPDQGAVLLAHCG